jgi:hypothetical protein
MNPRWEGDDKGYGIADARAFGGLIGELLHASNLSDWVAEGPEVHLLPHLKKACERTGSSLAIESSRATDDGVFTVTLRWRGAASPEAVRGAIFTLVGSVAETATYVRQRRTRPNVAADGADPEPIATFDVVTGVLSGDSTFGAHGHVLVLKVLSP